MFGNRYVDFTVALTLFDAVIVILYGPRKCFSDSAPSADRAHIHHKTSASTKRYSSVPIASTPRHVNSRSVHRRPSRDADRNRRDKATKLTPT